MDRQYTDKIDSFGQKIYLGDRVKASFTGYENTHIIGRVGLLKGEFVIFRETENQLKPVDYNLYLPYFIEVIK